MEIHYAFEETLFGEILIASNEGKICYLVFTDNDRVLCYLSMTNYFPSTSVYLRIKDRVVSDVVAAINEGKKNLDFPVMYLGSTFYQWVWEALREIPFGQTVSYTNIAVRIGSPKAARAVGKAIGENRIALLIPCHRVIGASGALSGYRWGVHRKRALLDWELEFESK